MGPSLRLSLNALGVKQGQRDVSAAFDKIKQDARKMSQDVDTASRKTETAINRVGKAANKTGKAGMIFGQVATQFGDMAVQIGSGQGVMRALGQQMPQVAGAFSMLGGTAAGLAGGLGLVFAVGFPLISMFMNMGDSAEKSDEKLNELADTLQRLNAMQKATARDLDAYLNNTFGENASAVARLINTLKEAEFVAAMKPVKDAMTDVSASVDRIEVALDTVTEFERMIKQGVVLSRSQLAVYDEMKGILADNLSLAADMVINVDNITSALDKIGQSKSRDELISSMAAALEKLQDIGGPAADQAIKGIQDMAEEAGVLNDVLAAAAGYAADVGGIIYNVGPWAQAQMDKYAGRGGGPSSTKPVANFDLPDWMTGRTTRARANPEKTELENWAKGIKPVLTLLQEYEQNMTKLNRAKEIGAITAAEFAAKEQLLTTQFQIATGAVIDYTSTANVFADSLSDSMMSLVDGTMSFKDAMKSMATAVIKDLYRILVVQQMVNAVMGAFGYSMGTGGQYIKTPAVPAVPSGDGGGYTGNGARVGGLDGKGGFLTMLHPQESVIDHTKGQSSGTTVVQNINISAGVAQTVRAEMMNLLPQFKQQAVAGVLDAKRRGGSYGGSFA